MNNYKFVLKKISESMEETGVQAKLIAVSKKKPVEAIENLYSLGARCFGENYLQEATKKIPALQCLDIEWHYIGALQTKKIKEIVTDFCWIHSVESIKHLKEIEKRSKTQMNVLIEVNLAQEKSKSGVLLEYLDELLQYATALEKVKVCGLMIMPPFSDNPENSRVYFREARELLLKKCQEFPNLPLTELSMGTSGDYVVALEEGATMIRLGTTLFGKRV